MARIKSASELEDLIDQEMAFRKREIALMKSLLRSKKSSKESTVLAKSLILISYSHWEGFVKTISQKYLEYIKFLGLDSSGMAHELSSAIFLNNISKNMFSHEEKIDHVIEAFTNRSYKHQINPTDLVDARSNLNSEVLHTIIRNLGLTGNEFKVHEIFLDSIILKNRNDFAHGENRPAEVEDANEIADKTLELMEQYKTRIQNALTLKEYEQ